MWGQQGKTRPPTAGNYCDNDIDCGWNGKCVLHKCRYKGATIKPPVEPMRHGGKLRGNQRRGGTHGTRRHPRWYKR